MYVPVNSKPIKMTTTTAMMNVAIPIDWLLLASAADVDIASLDYWSSANEHWYDEKLGDMASIHANVVVVRIFLRLQP